eukprot:CAMPEP_0179198918 /NCGR_PEP_ID=MMETSP0796-20121207/98953_1 /TAXON_ID=73915 /ORGANISM="Pyrodinium bahamense, Strain pbaha01" /LENGTH=66 /DNA_ID=CAMNT_0020903395 /DNA_START=29 /DNA_END=225 /DNA_ORIENTATION=-
MDCAQHFGLARGGARLQGLSRAHGCGGISGVVGEEAPLAAALLVGLFARDCRWSQGGRRDLCGAGV